MKTLCLLIFNVLSPSIRLVPMEFQDACLDIARRPYTSPFSNFVPCL